MLRTNTQLDWIRGERELWVWNNRKPGGQVWRGKGQKSRDVPWMSEEPAGKKVCGGTSAGVWKPGCGIPGAAWTPSAASDVHPEGREDGSKQPEASRVDGPVVARRFVSRRDSV